MDWKTEIERAFASNRLQRPSFDEPATNPEKWLTRAVPTPPTVLVELLRQCDGVVLVSRKDGEEGVVLVLPAIDIAKETVFQHEMRPVLKDTVPFGSAGDGRLFVMPAQADARRVGIYDAERGAIEWLYDDLSSFFIAYAHLA